MAKSAAVRVGVHEAKTRLSKLLRIVDGGQEVEITRGGRLVARIVPASVDDVRQLGTDEGTFVVPEDFDAPLPDEILNSFSG